MADELPDDLWPHILACLDFEDLESAGRVSRSLWGAYQEKQMIISCDHMLGTEIDEREYGWPVNGLHEISIRTLNGMSSHR